MPRTRLAPPFDPYCERYAADMTHLDFFWAESQEQLEEAEEDEKRRLRVEYIQKEEGTYNPKNGHFTCDGCYIKLGMPVTNEGWKAP
jgi:hypothetical protein